MLNFCQQRAWAGASLLAVAALVTSGFCALPTGTAAPATAGQATFRVSTKTYGGHYSPRHVLAIWVADQQTNFVKTLKRQAQEQQAELDRWNAARKGWTRVDGVSGATLSTHTAHTVTWDCTGTNGLVVPDGNYFFLVEFSEHETTTTSLGAFTTNGVGFFKGTAAVTNRPPNQTYFTDLLVTYTPSVIPHDLAVTAVGPTVAHPDIPAVVHVGVTNLAANAESFTVTVSNLTTATLIGAKAFSGLAGYAGVVIDVPWNTTGLEPGDHTLLAAVGPVTGETSLADNVRIATVTVRPPIHEVAVVRLDGPLMVCPGAVTNLAVLVTNLGDFAESFSLTLFDETARRLIGTTTVDSLSPGDARMAVFEWNATNVVSGYHRLRAEAGTVAGDLNPQNNATTRLQAVACALEPVTIVNRGSRWRYHDKGIDLSLTPWKEAEYYDGFWSEGAAPLGYNQTNLNTTLYYGPDSASKHPAYYFRRYFYADAIPTELTFNIRRDDGFVLYLNGCEILRDYMASGPVEYSTLATNTVTGAAQYLYNQFKMTPTNLVFGLNMLAAEVHQASRSSSDIVWDLEMSALQPAIPPVHDTAVLALNPPGGCTVGETVTISLVLTNRGNATETATAFVEDVTAGATVGRQTVSGFLPGAGVQADLDWNLVGASPGLHQLLAYTVAGGVTNLTSAVLATVALAAADSTPVVVNTTSAIGGRCSALAATGAHLLAGLGATLEIWDRAAPEQPTRLSALRLPGLIEQIAVRGARAFLACGSAGVQVVDFTNPANPVHLHTLKNPGHSHGLALEGDRLFVAAGMGGLRVFGTSATSAPALMGVLRTEGPARAVATAGAAACVLDGHAGLLVLNVADPRNPKVVGSIRSLGPVEGLTVLGSRAYVLAGDGQLVVIDLSRPDSPSVLGNLSLPGPGQALAANGPNLYVACGSSGLLSVDASVPSALVPVATNSSLMEASGLALAGTTLYVANGLAGFQTFDVATPATPVHRGDFAVAIRAVDAAIAGQFAYVACGESGLRVYSLANPARPVLVSRSADARNARSVAVSGRLAVVGDGQSGLRLFDVSVPERLVLAGQWLDPAIGLIRSVGFLESRVVATDGRRLVLVDFTDPVSPRVVAQTSPPAFTFSLRTAQDKVYAACGHAGVLILGAAENQFHLLGSFDTPGLAGAVSLSGSLACIADGRNGWLLVDVSDPAVPRLVNHAQTRPVMDVAVAGVLAALGNGANDLTTVDIARPLTPLPVRRVGALIRTMRLAASDSTVLVAEDDAGLAILSSPVNDADRDGLPDDWERQIVEADPSGTITALEDVWPADDFDGDGLSNYEEYVAGTSPIDANSVFAVAIQAVAGESVASLQWHSRPGRVYTIYKSADLNRGFVVLQDGIPATPPLNTFADVVSGGTAYYLVGVR